MCEAFKRITLGKPMPFDVRPWADQFQPTRFHHTPLFRWAIDEGHLPLLYLDPSNEYCFTDDQMNYKDAQSDILTAAKHGHLRVVEFLLGHLPIDMRISGGLLVDSAELGYDSLVRLLLERDEVGRNVKLELWTRPCVA
jgi:hypothetical protein